MLTSDMISVTVNKTDDARNLIPFIFARATKESQDLYEQGKGDLVIQDWIVVIALPDFKVYDSRWMDDPEQGKFCLIPDVDLSIDKTQVYPSFAEARYAVGIWWVNQMTAEAIAGNMVKSTKKPSETIQEFTVYWENGTRTLMKCVSVEYAITITQGADALKDIAWYDKGNTNTHKWDTATKNWQRISQIPNDAKWFQD